MNNILRLIALFFVFTLNAQELDLNSAIQLAKTNNRSLQNANSDIKIAQQKRLETIASGLPQISLSANYNNAFDQPVSLVPLLGNFTNTRILPLLSAVAAETIVEFAPLIVIEKSCFALPVSFLNHL